jgi:hypothetical protein
MNITPNKIKWFLAIKEQLLEEGERYYKIHNGVESDRSQLEDLTEDKFFGVRFIRESNSYGCCGGDDETYMDIPYELLYNSNWEEELKDQLFNEQMERLKAKELREAAEKAERKAVQDKADLANYKRLKAKFEKVNV